MEDYLAPLWKLLAEQMPGTDIQKCGENLAEVLDKNLNEISRQKRILEEILGWKTPVTKAWEDFAKVSVGDPFADAVRAILKELVGRGHHKVDTRLVYREITKQGVQNSRKNPKTAIGNIIYRTPGWNKIAIGVYEFQVVGK